MDKIKIVILCGKAGAGKDATLHKLMELYSDKYNEIVSCTTRPPREGEVDGVNYHFLTVEQFTEKILNGDMLEATEFNGWHYGTMLSSLSREKVNVGVFNPAGVACLLENRDLDLWIYEIEASSKTRLIRQLNREQYPNVEEIFRRYYADEKDFREFDELDYGNASVDSLINETQDDLEANANWIAAWTLQDN